MNPYEVLRIEKTATPKQIERAYRKRARESHPDRGGSDEDFKRIQKCYEVLSNPEKRRLYDETGTFDDQPDNTQQQVLMLLSHTLMKLVHAVVTTGSSIRTREVIRDMIVAIRQEQQHAEKQLHDLTRMRDEFQECRKRLECPILAQIAEGHVAKYREECRKTGHLLDVTQKALAILNDAKYRKDGAESFTDFRTMFESLKYSTTWMTTEESA